MTGQEHVGRLVSRGDASNREFRAECACGWASVWRSTNACMGNHRRHVAQHRRQAARA